MLSTVATQTPRNSRIGSGGVRICPGVIARVKRLVSRATKLSVTKCSEARRNVLARTPVFSPAVAAQDSLDIAEFTAHLRNVTLPMGLIIDDIRIYGQGIHLDREPFAAKLAQPGRLEVFVSEAQLARFLEKLRPAGLRDFRVVATDGMLTVHAIKDLILPIPAVAVARLRIQDERQLFVDLESVQIAGATSLKHMVQNQLDQINPILDAADLPMVRARLTQIVTDNGGVIVTGEVEP